MKKVHHKAASRGYAEYSWLKTNHTFSFAHYYNPDRVQFGALRVLNDDIIAPGMGFDTHPHNNMEIVTIPLEGTLEHRDNMGNHGQIKRGEIQVMSAGTGVYHSEFNPSDSVEGKFLQIWVFPNKKNIQPRYDQFQINPNAKHNEWIQLVSPYEYDEGSWIHQNAWFSICELSEGTSLPYHMHLNSNGVYFFLIKGSLSIENEILSPRDGLGLQEISQIQIEAKTNSTLLAIEIPMQL